MPMRSGHFSSSVKERLRAKLLGKFGAMLDEEEAAEHAAAKVGSFLGVELTPEDCKELPDIIRVLEGKPAYGAIVSHTSEVHHA